MKTFNNNVCDKLYSAPGKKNIYIRSRPTYN